MEPIAVVQAHLGSTEAMGKLTALCEEAGLS
jgi:hypothetical protein